MSSGVGFLPHQTPSNDRRREDVRATLVVPARGHSPNNRPKYSPFFRCSLKTDEEVRAYEAGQTPWPSRRILLSVEELELGLFQPLLTSTSLLLPLWRRSITFTDFPLLTTPWELAGDA
ncbi:hypothetical protein HU200_048029 [Digitaria exilis]|uniref:Uncharacterized protein n=1 Tax=Digitaria exilis TaxID=1010633 RepID=A0A835B1G5_9POAL|nr:hypothetical protein HU200_048029 [Digitaria exilis]